jgi:hypothetical protein
MDEDKSSNIASIDDEREWKWTDVDYMFTMKFNREGDSKFVLDNPPIKVYKIKRGAFVVEEPIENHEDRDFKKGEIAPLKSSGLSAFDKSKKINKHEFQTFTKLINFFDNYNQGL